MPWRIETGRLHMSGVSLSYMAFGKGKKPLVLIQGLNTRGIKGAVCPLAWMYRMFAADYRVYLFDRRDDVPDGFTVREIAGDVAMAMDALGVGQADVWGVSQGGMIAQYLAIDRPELVHKLVLAVTLSRSNDAVRAVIENWIALTERGDMKRLIADMAEKMYSQAYMKRYRWFMPLLTVLQAPADRQRFIALANACLTCQAYDELERITCPVLVIGGKEDRIVTAAASAEMAEKLKCELYLYENLGHAAYEEAGDFNQRVFDFLQS